MSRKTVLATAAAGTLAFLAYSTTTIPIALATGVELNSGLLGLVSVTGDPDLVLVKKGGGGGKGKGAGRGHGGGKSHAKRGDGGGKSHVKRGDGGGKSHAKRGDGGGKSHAKRGDGGGKSHAKRGDGGDKSYAKNRDGGKGYAKRGDEHRDGDNGHKRRKGGGKSIIVYRDGHRYWRGRQIWWWGPLVYSYDPCIRWVRFCADCAAEPINICYDESYIYDEPY